MTMALYNLELPEGSPNVYATKETLDKLGWIAERLPKIAGTDVLVLSGNDLEGIGRTRFTPEMRLSAIFSYAGMQDIPAEEKKAYLESLKADVAEARGYDFDGVGNDQDLVIITAPDLDLTPRQFMSMFTGIPEEMLGDVPGRSIDYVAAIMFHEAAHGAQPLQGPNTVLDNEVDADSRALKEIQRAHEEGYDIDPAVARIWMEARTLGSLSNATALGAVSAFLNGEDPATGIHTHATHIGLENMALPHQAQGDADAMLAVNAALNIAVGSYALQYMTEENNRARISGQPLPFDPGELGQYGSSIIKIHDLGWNEAMADPLLTRTALAALREKGYIADGTPEAAYADRVLPLLDKYADTSGYDPAYQQNVQAYFAKMEQHKPATADESRTAPELPTPRPGSDFTGP